MKDFIGRFIKLSKGPIYDETNEILGEHNGATLYTIGQRQGLQLGGVSGKDDLPWYVYKKDIKNNIVYVCQGVDNELLFSSGLECEKISWINDNFQKDEFKCLVQIRHQHIPVNCKISHHKNKYIIKFSEDIRGVAPGQSAVFYDDNMCLGGGIISKAF